MNAPTPTARGPAAGTRGFRAAPRPLLARLTYRETFATRDEAWRAIDARRVAGWTLDRTLLRPEPEPSEIEMSRPAPLPRPGAVGGRAQP